MLTIIAAIAKNNAIGFRNKLIYWLPNDLRRFKQLTTGHTIIMGRKTFESLPKGALPNRRNVVLSRNADYKAEGAEVFASLGEALNAVASADEELFIIGGETLYREALPLCRRLCLTEIDDTPAEADAFFPPFSRDDWRITAREDHQADERHSHDYHFVDYIK